jgi:hypothetical protein
MRFAMGAEHDERDHDACGHCSKGPLRALVSGWRKTAIEIVYKSVVPNLLNRELVR